MHKQDYQKQLSNILNAIQYCSKNEQHSKPTLLLHACCAPCSSYVIEYLSSFFDITIYYYNPNIHPESEYNRRLEELKKFLSEFPLAVANKIQLVVPSYNPEDFFIFTKVNEDIALQKEPERGERCRRCYFLRMKKAWDYAKENSFSFFTTTLSISPYKDAEMINQIGFSFEATEFNHDSEISTIKKNSLNTLDNSAVAYIQSHNLKYLPADFKKQNGFLRSLQLSKQYNLYRQDYCGCIFSKENNSHINRK